MTTPQCLLDAEKAYVVSPAGHGKTHIIAEAVALNPLLRQLVLTHTHAGVDSLRRKMKNQGVSASSYHIETIAGFALRYSSSYPKISGVNCLKPSDGQEWNQVYEGFSKLLDNRHIQDIIKASYQGMYVDEYQDCTEQQHNLIVQISDLIPTRLLGDPLQGIYDFGNNTIVDWTIHVEPDFEALPELDYPWRWDGENKELGEWLSNVVRPAIESNQPISLEKLPSTVIWKQLPNDPRQYEAIQKSVCNETLKNNGNAIVIYPHGERESQCVNFVKGLPKPYQMVETIDCKNLMKTAKELFETKGFARALVLIDFLGMCFSPISSVSVLSTLKRNFKNGKIGNPRSNVELASSLQDIVGDNSLKSILRGLEAFYALAGLKCYRRELYRAMCNSIQEFDTGKYESLWDAAWEVRNRTRQIGRKIPRFAVGRTLLIKGLEFDHAILLDADALDPKNLYVALTRGRSSLTILSRSNVINPYKNLTKTK